MTTLVWLRQDLRLSDHPALTAAIARGGAVIPVYVHAPEELGAWTPGAASNAWLHRSLAALDGELVRAGSRLIRRRGPTLDALRGLLRETGADAVYWSRAYEPAAAERDRHVEQALRRDGVAVRSFPGALLVEPDQVTTQKGDPFKVFTPFYRAFQKRDEPDEPLPAPNRLPAPDRWPDSLPLDQLGLSPRLPWDCGFWERWQPGSAGAETNLQRFLDEALATYPTDRDRPDRYGTSRLSPHLHVGEISPRQLWHACRLVAAARNESGLVAATESYLRQLCWREFAHHLLVHFPHTTDQPLYDKYADFAWRNDPTGLRAWQRGRTGYPIVDAGLRELWATGWMHNRVRMIAGSFLVKDLLLPWQTGARWFWDTLVDADLANNTLGWQWVGGCGADAAPYFRVFNPVTQSQRFDPDGTYLRRWLPELARLPDRYLHAPWESPATILREAGIRLRHDYPHPIVDHAAARERALEAYGNLG